MLSELFLLLCASLFLWFRVRARLVHAKDAPYIKLSAPPAEVDYIIVGAGPAGLSACRALVDALSSPGHCSTKQTPCNNAQGSTSDGCTDTLTLPPVSVLIIDKGDDRQPVSFLHSLCTHMGSSPLSLCSPDMMNLPGFDEGFLACRPMRVCECASQHKSRKEEQQHGDGLDSYEDRKSSENDEAGMRTKLFRRVLSDHTAYRCCGGMGGLSWIDWGIYTESILRNSQMDGKNASHSWQRWCARSLPSNFSTEHNPLSWAFASAVEHLLQKCSGSSTEVNGNTEDARPNAVHTEEEDETKHNAEHETCKSDCPSGDGVCLSNHVELVWRAPLRLDRDGRRQAVLLNTVLPASQSACYPSSPSPTKRLTSSVTVYFLPRHDVTELRTVKTASDASLCADDACYRVVSLACRSNARRGDKSSSPDCTGNSNAHTNTTDTGNAATAPAIKISDSPTNDINNLSNDNYYRNDTSHTPSRCAIRVRRGVVVCAGSVHTPFLLAPLLSQPPRSHADGAARTHTLLRDGLALPIIFQTRPGVSTDAANNARGTRGGGRVSHGFGFCGGSSQSLLTETMVTFSLSELYTLHSQGHHSGATSHLSNLSTTPSANSDAGGKSEMRVSILLLPCGGRDVGRYAGLGWDRTLGAFTEATTMLLVVHGLRGLHMRLELDSLAQVSAQTAHDVNIDANHLCATKGNDTPSENRAEWNESRDCTGHVLISHQNTSLPFAGVDCDCVSQTSSNTAKQSPTQAGQEGPCGVHGHDTTPCNKTSFVTRCHCAGLTASVEEQVTEALLAGIDVCRRIAQTAPMKHLLTGVEAMDCALLAREDGTRALQLAHLLHTPARRQSRTHRSELSKLLQWSDKQVRSTAYMTQYIRQHAYWLGMGSGSSEPFLESHQHGEAPADAEVDEAGTSSSTPRSTATASLCSAPSRPLQSFRVRHVQNVTVGGCTAITQQTCAQRGARERSVLTEGGGVYGDGCGLSSCDAACSVYRSTVTDTLDDTD